MNKPSILNRVASFILAIGILTPTLLWSQSETVNSADSEAPVAPPVPAVNPEKAMTDLQQAYQKEFAFLAAQKADLEARVTAFQQRATNEANQAETRIDSLQGSIVGLQSRADRINDLLTEADRNIESIEDNRGTLEATYQQAKSTLEQISDDLIDANLFENSDDLSKIALIFGTAAEQLNELGTVRSEPGKFYLVDGTEATGNIIKVGNIAAYGVSNAQSEAANAGVLAPAGEGRYKLWNNETAEQAQALLKGGAPNNLPIFLYETLNKSIEETEKRGVIGTIEDGGSIAWIIVALGVLALLMALLRSIFLRQASGSTSKILAAVSQHVSAGDHTKALEACKKRGGATGRVMGSAIRNLDRDREHIEDIISEAILHENAHLNRFGNVIMVVAAVAPLLGLLGTVTGMITTFDIITEFGTGDPKLLSGGISIALITTEIGLIVAIPALILGNLLNGWAEGIKENMEKAALRVINLEQQRRIKV